MRDKNYCQLTDSAANQYKIEVIIRPDWKIIEEIKSNKSSFSYISLERKVIVE